MKKNLSDVRVIVATHVYGTGASQDLVRYFNTHKVQRLLFIGHPLFYDPLLRGSGREEYSEGRKIAEYYSKNRPIPLFIGYALHVCKSLIWVLRTGKPWDIYIGSNNVNAFVGILLKRMGMVKKVIYYVIDYNPNRYDQPLVNFLYQHLDQYCVSHADETWNMSPRMEEGRKKYFGFTGGNQKVVPVGLWLSESVSLPISRIQRHTIAFVGHVQQKQGVQYVLRAMPRIIQKIPDFRLLVIGGGDYVSSLRDIVKELHLESRVEFTGFIKNHKDIDILLSKCALGVALYDRLDGDKISFSYFGNPTKVKAYQSAGLPVLISDVPYNAVELEREGCGKIISQDPKNISDAIISIVSDTKILEKYRANVRKYRQKFDWNIIFSENLKELI